MSVSEDVCRKPSRRCGRAPAAMGIFERFLTLWVAFCIVVGIVLGQVVPGVFHVLGDGDGRPDQPSRRRPGLADDHADAAEDRPCRARAGREHWRGIATTVGVNWLVKPFSMALLGWLFIAHLFRPCCLPGRSTATSPD